MCAVVLAAALGLTGSGCGEGPTQPTEITPAHSAIVTANEARFVFAPMSQSVLRWNQDSTPPNSFEYFWTVLLQNGTTTYDVGYYMLKVPGAAPASGALPDLLQVGLCGVFEAAGRPSDEPVRTDAARCEAEGQQVVLHVSDAETLRQLFSARPQRAVFRVKLPGQATVLMDVDVQYQ